MRGCHSGNCRLDTCYYCMMIFPSQLQHMTTYYSNVTFTDKYKSPPVLGFANLFQPLLSDTFCFKRLCNNGTTYMCQVNTVLNSSLSKRNWFTFGQTVILERVKIKIKISNLNRFSSVIKTLKMRHITQYYPPPPTLSTTIIQWSG